MEQSKLIKKISIIIPVCMPIFLCHPVLADTSSVAQVDSFIRNLIKAVGGLAGLVAALFFVIGGFQYMSSSGNPDRMERAKRTLIHAGIGLSIVMGAFVISSIVSNLATNAFGN